MTGQKAEKFRGLVAAAADHATAGRKTASVREFAEALGERHAKALGLLTGADYAELREGLAAWRKRLELEKACERVYVLAARLDRVVAAGLEGEANDLPEPTDE